MRLLWESIKSKKGLDKRLQNTNASSFSRKEKTNEVERMELRGKADKTGENIVMPLVNFSQTCHALLYLHVFAPVLLLALLPANSHSSFKIQLIQLTAFPLSSKCRVFYFCMYVSLQHLMYLQAVVLYGLQTRLRINTKLANPLSRKIDNFLLLQIISEDTWIS